jgi:hypothetical protein
MCRNCRFVPIGAGLDKLPKKKKRRVRRYVEPGSSRPFLTFAFLGLFAWGCVQYKPWEDDWELVRALMGQGRHHSVVGKWEVVKHVTIKTGGKPLIGRRVIEKGLLTFGDKGKVSVTFVQGTKKTAASGRYSVTGHLVSMNEIKTSSTAVGKVPDKLDLRLSWSGPNKLVATNPNEAIYLRRREEGGSTFSGLLQMRLKPESAKVPGAMRGVIATMEENTRAGGL